MNRILALAGALALCATAVRSQPSDTWQVVGTPAISDGIVLCCALVVDGHNVVHVAYQDLAQSAAQASVQRFAGGAWTYDGPKGAGSIGRAWYNQLAVDWQDNVYLACRDYAFFGKLNVRLYLAASGTWVNVGPFGSSPNEAHYTAVKVGTDGAPVVIFADRSTSPSDKASVMRFSPITGLWTALGGFGISPNSSLYDAVALDHNNVPYVGYADSSHPDNSGIGKASVRRYDTSTGEWEYLGAPGFTSSGGLNMWLELDHADVPYIVYQLYHTALFVLRWNGSSWVQVGGSASGTDRPTIETEPWRQWIPLRFDSQNTPYVAYQMFDNGTKAAVRKFDGTNWVPVGNLGFSDGAADYMALAIDKEDVPWLAFRDAAHGQRLTVMRYKPTTQTYCTPTVSTVGCVAQISAVGVPSVSRSSPYTINAVPVINNRLGLLIYGFAPDHIPFGAGTLCIQPPLKRTTSQSSGGATFGTDCSGAFTYDFNALIHSGFDPSLTIGRSVFAQYWYRDPPSVSGSALSNAVRFFIGP
jgi:hypothetical protein